MPLFIHVQASATTHSAKVCEWIAAADFVGYIIFFVAIFFVIHALYIMFLSMTVSRRYADLDQTSISDILVEFTQAKQSSFNMFLMKFRFFPLLKVLKNVEFKISWAVFRDTYVLPSQFDYVEYVSGSLRQYALHLVDINKTSWLVLVMLVLFNYFRMLAFDQECRHGFSPEELEEEAERDVYTQCESQHRFLFHLSGAFLVSYVVSLFAVGRIYQFRIIGRAGVLGVNDYEDFLMFEEASLVKHEQQKLKQASAPAQQRKRKSSVVVFKSAMEGFLLEQQKAEKVQEAKKAKRKVWRAGSQMFARLRPPPTAPMSSSDPPSSDSSLSMGSSILSIPLPSFSPATKAVVDRLQSNTRKFYMKLKVKGGRQEAPARMIGVKSRDEKRIKFSEDLSEIFFMKSPLLFFKGVEISILMNSLYMSVWFCNYMTSTTAIFEQSIMMIIPIIVCFPIIGEVVKIASLIECAATLNLDVVGTIIEDLEEKEQLKNEMQKRLKMLPMSEDECMETVNLLFTELASASEHDEIDDHGFRRILGSLKIFFRYKITLR